MEHEPRVEPTADADATTKPKPVRYEERLRRLSGRKGRHEGPIVAVTRGWVSRDGQWHMFAARFLDFALLTDEHLVLCSTGFFSRRPRRQVFREPFTRLGVVPLPPGPPRNLRIVGDFSRPLRLQLRNDAESLAFAQELLERTRIHQPLVRPGALDQPGEEPHEPTAPA